MSKYSRVLQTLASLRDSRAAIGAVWVLFGSAGTQVVRFVSNIILAALLVPDVFGVMALAYAVIIGLSQLSDVGLREAVVNSKRIEDPAFMQTAWTLQVLRSLLMGVGAAAIAWPFAAYYDESVLAPVLCMVGLSTAIGGFKSVALLAYDKRLDLRTQIITGLCVQVSGLVVMIVWALIAPSIWALVVGQLFSACVELILSYVVFEGHHSRFAWDRKAVSECFHFGKWIVLSSSISYITNQGDRLIIGKFMSMAELGVYSIASNWAALVSMVSFELSIRVLHPFFRQSLESSGNLRAIGNTRLGLNTVYTLICLTLALCAEFLVELFYDDRYRNVAWMLQVLAIGQIPRSFTVTLRPFLIAKGDSFSQTVVSAGSAVILVGLILLGGELGGTSGVVLAYAFSGFLMHPLMMMSASRHGFHCWLQDGLLMLGGSVLGLAALYALDGAVFEVMEDIGASHTAVRA